MAERAQTGPKPDAPEVEDFRSPRGIDLSLIIVNWNSADFVRNCLASINPGSCAHRIEVIVVDSGSFDQCGGMLSREFPAVRFVQAPENIGFAKANNLGASFAAGRFLLFLNPDTEVVGNALERLVQVLDRHPEAGLAGALLHNFDGSVQTSCIQSFPTLLNQFLDSEWLRGLFPRSPLWGMAPLFEKDPAPAAVEVVSGACILIRRGLFEKLAGFDTRFFMYSEDLDLCRRVRAAGQVCLFVPEARIVHHGGGSSSSARSMFSVVMMRESVCRLFLLHRGPVAALGYRCIMAGSALLRLPLLLGKGGIQRMAGRKARSGAVRKWAAIFRWSLGLESWAASKNGSALSSPKTAGVGSTASDNSSCVA
jgi:hypothetical protein